MDTLAGLLDGPRAHGAFLLRCVLEPPWSLRVQDEAPLTLLAVVSGGAWLLRGERPPIRLEPGALAVVTGPEPYSISDDPATPTQVVVWPGQGCSAPDGTPLTAMSMLGVRTWGNAGPQGPGTEGTVMLVGTYQLDGEVSRRLLNTLPPVLTLGAGSCDTPLIAYLAAEMGRDEPGQEAVLDRLLDLLLIGAVRAWFARDEAEAPGWYAAHSDPVVGPALRLLHHQPAEPWTVESLARETGVSRAALARRFTTLVGEPPMAFLTSWRLALAADLLLEPGATVGSVAHKVGYSSAFALSAAFKRVRGSSPAQHRARALRQASADAGVLTVSAT